MKQSGSSAEFKPLRLQPGDRIHIVAPASPVRKELFERGVSTLRALGFQVVYGDVFQKWRYLAGEDDHRHAQLQEALMDPDCRAVFFARGGYGSIRLLSDARSFAPSDPPKILAGCSDITTLHQYFQRIHGWTVFHSPMPSGDVARGQLHIRSFRDALMETDPYALEPEGVETLSPGSAVGVLRGGCLTLLHACIGTPWEPDWEDSIVFLEDVSTKPYQIDRMLTHLKNLGKFRNARAVIFGEMKDCIQTENQGYTLQEVILDVLDDLKIPVYFGFPSGHVKGLNWTIPLGVRARVGHHPAFHLEILEGAVR